jgi:hypothetical protein
MYQHIVNSPDEVAVIFLLAFVVRRRWLGPQSVEKSNLVEHDRLGGLQESFAYPTENSASLQKSLRARSYDGADSRHWAIANLFVLPQGTHPALFVASGARLKRARCPGKPVDFDFDFSLTVNFGWGQCVKASTVPLTDGISRPDPRRLRRLGLF